MQQPTEVLDQEKQALLKHFKRQYPKYLKQNKVQFPILDECLVQFSQLFPQSKHQGLLPTDGRRMNVFSSVSIGVLQDIVTFANNFPNSSAFGELSDTQAICSLAMTSMMKLYIHLFPEQYTLQTIAKINLYNTNDTQSQMDRLMFRLVVFFVEDMNKYKLSLLSPKDIYKTKAMDCEIKKEKKKRQSLLSMVEQQNEPQENIREDIMNQLQFESEDAHCRLFWNLITEVFSVIQKKVIKLNLNNTQNQEPDKETSKLFPVDSDSLGKRRLRFAQSLNSKMIRELTKVQQKLQQSRKRNKFENGVKPNQIEANRLIRYYNCLIQSWPEILIQAAKVPYFRQMGLDLTLISKLSEGFFDFQTKQRAQLMSNLIETVSETECFRQIIEFRQQTVVEVTKELMDVEKVLSELNHAKDQQSKVYRAVYKRQLQLVEFDNLFLNGAQYLGSDVHGKDYYIFANDLHNLYYQLGQEWFQLNVPQIQELLLRLNPNGVRERELQRNIQKLFACELLGDNLTQIMLQVKGSEIKEQEIIKVKNPYIPIVQKTFIEIEQKLTQALTIKHQRWGQLKLRNQYKEMIEKCSNPVRLAEFLQHYQRQLDNVEALGIDQSKLAIAQNLLKPIEMKYIEKVVEKLTLDENTIFQDPRLFAMMERVEIIGMKTIQPTNFWQLGLGQNFKTLFGDYVNKIENYIQLNFACNLMLLQVEEFCSSFLQGEIVEDEELKHLAEIVFKEEKQERRQANQKVFNQVTIDVIE